MAIITSYPLDDDIEGTDTLLGVDGSGDTVKRFSLSELSSFFGGSGGGVSSSVANTFTAIQTFTPGIRLGSPGTATLDDYEEGTWTPVSQNAGLVISNIVNTGYTKIGNTVILNAEYSFVSTLNTLIHPVIGGLPYSCNSSIIGQTVYSESGTGVILDSEARITRPQSNATIINTTTLVLAPLPVLAGAVEMLLTLIYRTNS